MSKAPPSSYSATATPAAATAVVLDPPAQVPYRFYEHTMQDFEGGITRYVMLFENARFESTKPSIPIFVGHWCADLSISYLPWMLQKLLGLPDDENPVSFIVSEYLKSRQPVVTKKGLIKHLTSWTVFVSNPKYQDAILRLNTAITVNRMHFNLYNTINIYIHGKNACCIERTASRLSFESSQMLLEQRVEIKEFVKNQSFLPVPATILKSPLNQATTAPSSALFVPSDSIRGQQNVMRRGGTMIRGRGRGTSL